MSRNFASRWTNCSSRSVPSVSMTPSGTSNTAFDRICIYMVQGGVLKSILKVGYLVWMKTGL